MFRISLMFSFTLLFVACNNGLAATPPSSQPPKAKECALALLEGGLNNLLRDLQLYDDQLKMASLSAVTPEEPTASPSPQGTPLRVREQRFLQSFSRQLQNYLPEYQKIKAPEAIRKIERKIKRINKSLTRDTEGPALIRTLRILGFDTSLVELGEATGYHSGYSFKAPALQQPFTGLRVELVKPATHARFHGEFEWSKRKKPQITLFDEASYRGVAITEALSREWLSPPVDVADLRTKLQESLAVTLLHEYLHFLQALHTPWGRFLALISQRLESIVANDTLFLRAYWAYDQALVEGAHLLNEMQAHALESPDSENLLIYSSWSTIATELEKPTPDADKVRAALQEGQKYFFSFGYYNIGSGSAIEGAMRWLLPKS